MRHEWRLRTLCIGMLFRHAGLIVCRKRHSAVAAQLPTLAWPLPLRAPPYNSRPLPHAGHKLQRSVLIGMRRIPADAGYLWPGIEAFAVQNYVAAPGTVLLNGVAGGTAGLVTDKEKETGRCGDWI